MSTCKGAWKLQDVRDQVLAGEWIQYNATADPGTLWAWGQNCFGKLGNNTSDAYTHKSSPIQIPGNTWTCIAAGDYNSFAIKSDGTLWSWGRGTFYGSLGTNSTPYSKSSPVQIPGSSWNDISAGNFIAMARKTDGTLWSWGLNNCGQLGNNTFDAGTCKSSPVQIPGTSWCDVNVGDKHTISLKTDGTLWSWGQNGGKLGDDSVTPRSSPIQVPGTRWIEAGAGERGSIARKTDGTLWTWGGYTYGLLGIGTVTSGSRSSPVQVPGTAWNQVSTSNSNNLARKTDGTLWSWGNGAYGAVGDAPSGGGYNVNRCSPVQIPGTTWSDISSGRNIATARKTDGTLWAWGRNHCGQLGDGTATNRSSPVQVPGTSWNDIASGSGVAHVLARKA